MASAVNCSGPLLEGSVTGVSDVCGKSGTSGEASVVAAGSAAIVGSAATTLSVTTTGGGSTTASGAGSRCSKRAGSGAFASAIGWLGSCCSAFGAAARDRVVRRRVAGLGSTISSTVNGVPSRMLSIRQFCSLSNCNCRAMPRPPGAAAASVPTRSPALSPGVRWIQKCSGTSGTRHRNNGRSSKRREERGGRGETMPPARQCHSSILPTPRQHGCGQISRQSGFLRPFPRSPASSRSTFSQRECHRPRVCWADARHRPCAPCRFASASRPTVSWRRRRNTARP